ncbi:Protein-lysine N-methyltransferase efm4 [Cystobasidiomycetes sp. EMM_F5]
MPGKDDMVAVRKPDWGRNGTISEAEYAKDIKATWLGHACFLVEFPTPSSTTSTAQQPRGLRVLFDPVFEHRCSPSQLVGPARYTPPPIPIKELPEVDAVVISHSHYDHTSVDSLQQIYKQQNRGSVHFFVPLGMKKWMKSINIPNEHITELDWWDNAVLTSKAEAEAESGNQLRFTCTPCQHFSGRGLFDRDATLWASWAVEAVSASAGPPACKVWFGGDTAYKAVPKGCTPEEEKLLPVCPAFKEIGQRFGGFDLALIPIGAYSPRWFMSRVHANPEDSVEIHSDIRSRRSVGIHWGTWQLTDERVMEPPERLAAAAKAKGLGADEFTTLEAIGATLRVGVGA